MLATVREMLNEAEERLRILGFPQEQIWVFTATREPAVRLPPLGGVFPISQEQKQLVQQCGQEYDVLIYYVIRSCEPELKDAFLYIDRDKRNWEFDREFLRSGEPRAIVHNYSYDRDEGICRIFL